jgi:hypothetical protein
VDAATRLAVEDVGHRLIAAILARPALLDAVPELEIDDFVGSYRHQAVWAAIRNLQARGRSITIDEIDANQRAIDVVRGTCYRLHCGADYLRALAATDSTPDRARDAAHVRAWAALLRRVRSEVECAVRAAEGTR